MRMLISRFSMTATPMIIVFGLLASGVSAMASQDDRSCSNRTLSGDYGSAADGVLLPAPGVVLQFRGVTIAHFNGTGNVTWVEHTVVGGQPLAPGWTAASGTYTVNPDCSGTALVISPNSPVPLKLFFVVVRQGNEIRAVLDAHAISTVFIKVE